MRPGLVIGGQYRLDARVGAGRFGTVWRATQLWRGREVAVVAVKVFHDHVNLHEILLLGDSNHSHIIGFRTILEHEGQTCLVMEFADGGSVRALLGPTEAGLPLEQAEAIVQSIAQALDFIHSRGIVHRDVKPENILIAGGNVKLADFGIIKAVTDGGASHSGACTPAYAAPELFRGRVSARSDIYSLGITAFELVTGRPPHQGSDEQMMHWHLSGQIDWPRSMTAKWREFIGNCVTKDEAHRWSAADASAFFSTDLSSPHNPRFSIPLHGKGICELEKTMSNPHYLADLSWLTSHEYNVDSFIGEALWMFLNSCWATG